MKSPIVSICIPTFNRATYLRECLESIVSQLTTDSMKEEVEIVIADNASTDNTESVVQEFTKQYSNIVYFKNEKNLGFDRSFLRLMSKSRGKYCLPIGDDDAFFENTIPTIVALLTNTTVPYLTLNNWGYDSELEKPVLPYPNIHIKEDKVYKTLSHYVRTITQYVDLVGIFVGLSGQVYLRDAWNGFLDKEKYFDTLAIHMHTALSVFNDKPYMLVAEPMIKTRSSNIRWDVFKGLETSFGRVRGTIKTALWVKNICHVPVSDMRLIITLFVREYWFTGKEIAKRLLVKLGLQGMIGLYRRLRASAHT